MKSYKLAFLATSAMVGQALAGGAAHAQSSTASAAVETIVVTGERGPQNIEGVITAQTEAKNRTTITEDYIETQTPGQTIIDSLAVVTPGLNFTNNDPYGAAGGNIRLHGFDGNRVALTFDGMPINDTGNYASFTNQLLDNELIASAQVNTGSPDVDAPTAASTGGTINFASRTPDNEFGGWVQYTHGDFNHNRYMAFVDTGVVGPWGTTAWFAVSDQRYDKFKGSGELKKTQYNAKFFQPIGGGSDFVSLAFHWNQNRNNAYFGPNLFIYNADGSVRNAPQYMTDPRGYEFDFNPRYRPIVSAPRAGFPGDVDSEPSTSNLPVGPGVPSGTQDPTSNNANYFALRINPSNTGNIRGQSKFELLEGLTLTVDPSFQYTLANGGTQNITIAESCNGASATLASCPVLTRQLLGAVTPSLTTGVDLNADGDINDSVRVMNPSNTNTRRYGLLSSLIWEVNDDHLLRAGYTLDYGRHRQTGDFGFIEADATYSSLFGGKDGQGRPLLTLDNTKLQNRNRFSIAMLNQLSVEYRGSFLDDSLALNVGLRAPFFKRELNQFCYTQNGSNTTVRCTSETPVRTLPNGNVQFAEVGPTQIATGTQYVAPYSRDVEYDDVLPNVGLSYFLGASQFFANYAESTSLPRTDNLYTVFRSPTATSPVPFTSVVAEPETSQTIEAGYRYNGGNLLGSIALWQTDFQNRIVSSFDQELGINLDRNVGAVEQMGVDASLGWSPVEEVAVYASASYNDSEVQDDVQTGFSAGIQQFAPTKGKQLTETPEWTFSTRLELTPIPALTFGVQGKYVGDRWVTDVNDQRTSEYFVFDLDARYSLEDFGLENTYVQVNVINLLDEDYIGSISSQTSSTFGQPGFGTPFAGIGAPRTASVTLRAGF